METLILDYRPVQIPCWRGGDDHVQLATRTYLDANGVRHYLVVDPFTLETYVVPHHQLRFRAPPKGGTPGYVTFAQLAICPFWATLMASTNPVRGFSNQGLRRSMSKTQGMFLTADLCPSVNPFEQAFFERLIVKGRQQGGPFPVAIALSGIWRDAHEREMQWLIDCDRQGELAITWVGHSHSHVYFADIDPAANFLGLLPMSFLDEVLDVEKAMLRNGIIPSVFFRFPGLISSEDQIRTLQDLSLIPLGAACWLAKGEEASLGDIVLVHGNGNEPQGIACMEELLAKECTWLPLCAAAPAFDHGNGNKLQGIASMEML